MYVLMESDRDNLEEFVEKVFSKPPQKPKTIQLVLEDYTREIAENNTANVIFDILLRIFSLGVKKLFGDGLDISDIDKDRMYLLYQYFMSFGFVIHTDFVDISYKLWFSFA